MYFKKLWQILNEAASGFTKHDGFKLSSSISFYTLLTIGPMMLVIIYISGLFWGRSAIEGTIYGQISGVVGGEAANQLQELIKNAAVEGSSFMAVIGIGALIVSSTTVFTQVQNAMNTIWDLQVKQGSSWQQMLKNRVLSFIFIVCLSMLMILLIIINGMLENFMSQIQELFPQIAFTIIYPVNLLITLGIVALFFAFIFKVLPDAYIKWRDVAVGALLTALLFMVGNYGITFYINVSNLAGAYGSAGSLIVLLIWIFYSATVLFFGAEISKSYALTFGSEIKPKEYAIFVKVVEADNVNENAEENKKRAKISG